MRAVISFFTAHIKYILVIYVLVQLIYIFFFSVSYKSDSLYHYQLAVSSLSQQSVYPSVNHLYEDYLIAPLFVNLQVLFLSIMNTTYTVGLLHVILNLLQLFVLYNITIKIFNKETAIIFVVLYILYLPNIGFILLNMTEVLFGLLFSLSLLFLLKGSIKDIFLSGLFAAASIGVRPTGWALLASLILFMFIYNSATDSKKVLTFGTGAILFFLIIGTATYISSGHFVISSVNYGTNLLIGANDDATGAFNDRVFNEGKAGFINNPQSKTYIEKQRYWYGRALNWIMENPIEWIKVFPVKLVHIYIWDDYAISPLLHMQDWNLYRIMKQIVIEENSEKLLMDTPIYKRILYISLQILHHIYYFLIVLIFIFLVIKKFKYIKLEKANILLLIVIGFSLFIPLISFGDPRFKYPDILLIMIIISPYINSFHSKTKIIT